MDQYVEHYDNGSVKVTGTKLNNVKTGVWTFYKKNGRKVMEAHFSDQGEPLFNFYFDSRGSLIEEGFVVVPHPNGKTSEEGLVKNCLKQGLWHYYDKEGNKRILGEHKNGLKQGYWKYFDAHGRLECIGTYYKNQWHGTVVFYNHDGSLRERREYQHGQIVSQTPMADPVK